MVNSNINKHLQMNGIFYLAGNGEFAFLEQQLGDIRVRLQIEAKGALKVYRSTDGGVTFPQVETIFSGF